MTGSEKAASWRDAAETLTNLALLSEEIGTPIPPEQLRHLREVIVPHLQHMAERIERRARA